MVAALAGFILSWCMFVLFVPEITGRVLRSICTRFMKGWEAKR